MKGVVLIRKTVRIKADAILWIRKYLNMASADRLFLFKANGIKDRILISRLSQIVNKLSDEKAKAMDKINTNVNIRLDG